MLLHVDLDPDAERALDRLPKNIMERVIKALLSLAQDPYRGKKLKGYDVLRAWPLTMTGGEYRIVYEVHPAEAVCHVVLIASRERVYQLLERKTRQNKSEVIPMTVTTIGNLAVDVRKVLQEELHVDVTEEDELVIERRGNEIVIRPINMDDVLERARRNRAEGKTVSLEEVLKKYS